jgi:DNA-binding transcriptional MocR family regulator
MRRLIEAQPPAERPRLYVTVSVLHNPTGASLGLHAAHQVLSSRTSIGFHIVEDDTYSHLAPAHSPRSPRSTRSSARSTSRASRRS